MAIITIREALNQAIREELARDENVFLMGEEVAAYQGAYKVTKGLLEALGPKPRLCGTPRPIASRRRGARSPKD